MKKITIFLLYIITLNIFFTTNVSAKELEEYDFTEIDSTVEEYGISFEELAQMVIKGDIKGAVLEAWKAVVSGIFSDFGIQKDILMRIIMIGIAGAVFANMSGVLDSHGIAGMGDYAVKITLLSVISGGMLYASSQAKEILELIDSFMEALLPSYTVAITFGGGSSTALAFYEIVMLIIFLADKVFIHMVLPAINIYMMITMMNYVSKENIFGKMSELIKEMIEWTNKSILAVIIGFNLIKNMINPVLDSLKGTMFNRAVSLIPGVGVAADAVTGVVIGSGVLIKNTIGVTAMIVLVMLCAMPVIKLFLFAYGCKAAGAVLEPISDKGYVGCVNGMHEGLKMLFTCVCNVLILFLLTIAILCSSYGMKMS